MPEISAEQLNILNRNNDLLKRLIDDPKQGVQLQRKLKELDPSLKFTAVDVEDTVMQPVREELGTVRAQLEALQAERLAEREAAQRAQGETKIRDSIGRAQAKGKLSPEATDGLVKFMAEKQVADAELALPAYLETLPKAPKPPATSSYAPQYANVYGAEVSKDTADEKAKLLVTNPDKFFDMEVGAILQEAAEAA